MSDGIIRRYLDLIAMLDRGEFSHACDLELEKALRALEEQPAGKGTASITINLKIAFDKGMVELTPELKSKVPGYAPRRNAFWADDGMISVQHPNQAEMFGGPRDASRERSA